MLNKSLFSVFSSLSAAMQPKDLNAVLFITETNQMITVILLYNIVCPYGKWEFKNASEKWFLTKFFHISNWNVSEADNVVRNKSRRRTNGDAMFVVILMYTFKSRRKYDM